MKVILLLMSLLSVASARADAANVLVSFSSVAPDTYADGRVVLDGEWYALAWSEGDAFGGLTPSGEPTDPRDRLLLLAPLARSGHCPTTFFQLPSATAPTNGFYSLLLLDTRNSALSAPAAARPLPIHALRPLATRLVSGGDRAAVVPTGDVTWSASVVAGEDYAPPVITAFSVSDARATIRVEGLLPNVKYNVKMGASPDRLTTYALDMPQSDVREATFVVTPREARFFQVVREPMKR